MLVKRRIIGHGPRASSSKRRVLLFAASLIGACAVAGGLVVSTAGSSPVTFGRIPASAQTATGMDWSLLPDYVSTVGPGGVVVGYVAKQALEDSLQPAHLTGPLNGGSYSELTVLPVYNRQLQQVGNMYPNVGYVPLGDPAPTEQQMTPTTMVDGGANGNN